MGVGVGICCEESNSCEGIVATEGRLHCVGVGAIVATIADNLSNFLSKSRSLVGVWPSLRAFAGRLRATCSTHSTLAFWHLGHVSFDVEQKYSWVNKPLANGGRVRWDAANLVLSTALARKGVSYSSFFCVHGGD